MKVSFADDKAPMFTNRTDDRCILLIGNLRQYDAASRSHGSPNPHEIFYRDNSSLAPFVGERNEGI